MRRHQRNRKGMILQSLQQVVDLGRLEAIQLQIDALDISNSGKQMQAVGTGQSTESHLLDPREPHSIRPASDQQTPRDLFRIASRKLPIKVVKTAAARIVKTKRASASGLLILRQGRFEVVPNQKHPPTTKEVHGGGLLRVCRTLIEIRTFKRL